MLPDPFPHAIIDGWFTTALLNEVIDEFPCDTDPRWKRFRNAREGKLEGGPGMWGPATIDYFDILKSRTSELEAMFDIEPLSMETIGGGYHLIPPGGRLEVHTDFNRSPRTNLYRRLNVLTYLNADWEDPGGLLILRGPDGDIEVAPEFGRTVIFETSDTSWHGHPVPAQRWRRSVAAYFFSPDPAPGYRADHSTVFWDA
jgi:hypothetical protein